MGLCFALQSQGVHHKSRKHVKMVLVGTAGSGKSTFCKQMQIIYKGGFEPVELENFKKVLLCNICSGIKLLLEAEENITEENRKKARYVLSTDENDIVWNEEMNQKLKTLWKEEAVQNAWHNRKQSILVPLDYLMENIDKYLSPDFVPSLSDVLRARQRSTGENITIIDDGSVVWHLLDLGGQISERQKWAAAFRNVYPVDALIYFVSLDEFDTPNPELATSAQYPTKMQLSFSVMQWCFREQSLLASETFSGATRIVFLNKSDLFKEKIKNNNRFSEFKEKLNYSGSNSYEECVEFLESKICKMVEETIGDDLPTHVHVVCALDTELMKQLTADIRTTIVMNSMAKLGLF